ncbi:calcium-responsive transcription factor-like isoform X2 [Penaeus japonicus]|uniref:calcium-responsive transcription factor-like isoform X2 n=1 Tax=Penaeus japonicus TaxID=27405 RepID=UPI001C70B00F|nr:calcium-responsive transcription factor-like isoform X2 [Penaeus japonicus]
MEVKIEKEFQINNRKRSHSPSEKSRESDCACQSQSTKLKVELPCHTRHDTARSWVCNFSVYSSCYEGYVTSLKLLHDLLQEFEICTHSYFIVQRTKRNFGKEPELKKLSGSIHWQDTQDNARPRLPCEGVPFLIMGTRTLDCHQGPDRDKKRKHLRAATNRQKDFENYLDKEHDYTEREWQSVKASKKLNCPAKIYIRHIIKFPEYECPEAIEDIGHRHAVTTRLQLDFKRREDIVQEHQFHVQLPSSHANHAVGEQADSSLPIDRHLSAFIQKKVTEEDITNTKEMKKLLEEHLQSSEFLFKGKELPSRNNTRYWPTLKQIRNHVMLARMRQRENRSVSLLEEPKEQQWQQICEDFTPSHLHSVMKKVHCLAKEVETLAGLCQDPYILCQVATGMEQLRDSLLPSSQSNEHYIEESEVSPPDSGQDKSKEGQQSLKKVIKIFSQKASRTHGGFSKIE